MKGLRELREVRKAKGEPVMYCSAETIAAARDGEHLLRTLSAPSGDCVIPLYSAPPAPVVPDTLPLSYLQGHQDGLEWAAQMAEANHPQTGDWLYDDPIALAAAIRKGPDMPFASGNSPVTPDGWKVEAERLAELHGCSFVVFRHGEEPQCADPTKVIISFTDKGLGYPMPDSTPATHDCQCRTCRPVTMNDMRFVVCPDCGNKRCPHANDHNNACAGSNEPGQVGSAYPEAPKEVG